MISFNFKGTILGGLWPESLVYVQQIQVSKRENSFKQPCSFRWTNDDNVCLSDQSALLPQLIGTIGDRETEKWTNKKLLRDFEFVTLAMRLDTRSILSKVFEQKIPQ